MVGTGTYNENVNVTVPNLTLKGAKANIDARTQPFIPDEESIITFDTFGTTGGEIGIVNLLAHDIIFNGFTV